MEKKLSDNAQVKIHHMGVNKFKLNIYVAQLYLLHGHRAEKTIFVIVNF